jgi:hypothetical protein
VRIPFDSGAYETRGVISGPELQWNLYAEPGPKNAPFPITLYPSPGLILAADYAGQATGRARGMYAASNRALYVVFGTELWQVVGAYVINLIGNLGADSGNPVSMCDNGITLVVVDGSPNGWTVDLATNAFAPIADPAFYGSNRVDFIDTFLIFNWPGTPTFYISDSNATTFNPLYFAQKEGYNDLLVSIAALHDNIWLFGAVTTEVWFNSGAADFPFQRQYNSIIQQGCIAAYSVTVADNAVFWLSQDRQGRNMLMRGEGYAAKRVSNFAVEDAWSTYPIVNNAVGMCYQIAGHLQYTLYFPSQNVTWVYDATTGFWHRRVYGANDDAWLLSCAAYWDLGINVNLVMAGDRSGPRLYIVDRNTFTDAGVPILRRRRWPHVLNDQKRLVHSQFVAAMQGTNLAPDEVSLVWSDDGGQTYGTPLVQTTNNASNGQYSWRRLGMARDRVYDLSWTAQGETALNGAWIEAVPSET